MTNEQLNKTDPEKEGEPVIFKAQMIIPANLLKDILEGSKQIARETGIRITHEQMIIKTWADSKVCCHEAIIEKLAFEKFASVKEGLVLEFGIFNSHLYSFVKGVEGLISLDVDTKRGTVKLKTLENTLVKEMNLSLLRLDDYEWRTINVVSANWIKIQSIKFKPLITVFENEGDRFIIAADEQKLTLANDSRTAELKVTCLADDFLPEDFIINEPFEKLDLPMEYVNLITRFARGELTLLIAGKKPFKLTHPLGMDGLGSVSYVIAPALDKD